MAWAMPATSDMRARRVNTLKSGVSHEVVACWLVPRCSGVVACQLDDRGSEGGATPKVGVSIEWHLAHLTHSHNNINTSPPLVDPLDQFYSSTFSSIKRRPIADVQMPRTHIGPHRPIAHDRRAPVPDLIWPVKEPVTGKSAGIAGA
jgi:hypothetical protein